MNTYLEGQPVRLEAFFHADAELADPTDIELKIWNNGVDRTVGLSGVTRDSVGAYSYEFIPSTVGIHSYQWDGTGAVVAFAGGKFLVDPKIK